MLVRRAGMLLLAIILLLSISGCGGEELAAKDYFLQALEKNRSIEDFKFSGEVDVKNLQYVEDASIAFDGRMAMSPFYLESENRLITTIEDNNLYVDITVLALTDSLYVNVPEVLRSMMPELNREYLRFTSTEQMLEGNLFVKAGELFASLPAESFTYATASAYSTAKIKVGKAVTITSDTLAGVGPFDNLAGVEVTFVFDRSDDLRQVVFAGEYSEAEYLAVNVFSGEINLTDINKGITTKREPPAADRTLDYDDIVLPPSID